MISTMSGDDRGSYASGFLIFIAWQACWWPRVSGRDGGTWKKRREPRVASREEVGGAGRRSAVNLGSRTSLGRLLQRSFSFQETENEALHKALKPCR